MWYFRGQPIPLYSKEKLSSDRVKVIKTPKTAWLWIDGRHYRLDRRSERSTKASLGEVLSPMTGTITDLRVKKGEKVQTGQALLVLSAMKMEYTLVAPQDGVVSNLSCNVGDVVEQGTLLVQVGESHA